MGKERFPSRLTVLTSHQSNRRRLDSPKEAMLKFLLLCLPLGVLLGIISGCAGLAIGGAATGASVAHDRRTAGTMVEDQAIEFKAIDALSKDPAFDNAHINVTSYNMAVLLSGEVRTPELRRRAAQIVKRIDKVSKVYNELAVAPASSLASRGTDTWITTKVKTSLFQVDGFPDFDPTRVKVVTERGIVYLMGLLRPREAEAVTSTVRRVGGVQKVVKLFEYIEQGTVT